MFLALNYTCLYFYFSELKENLLSIFVYNVGMMYKFYNNENNDYVYKYAEMSKTNSHRLTLCLKTKFLDTIGNKTL